MTYDEVSEEDRRDRRSAAEQGQLLPLAEEEIAALRLQVLALQSQVDAVSLDLEIARESLEQERAALQSQLLENDRLLGVIKERRANDRGAEPPETLQDVPDWCSRTLSGRVVLVGRAVRSLKEGTYKDVRLVAACVHALGHEGRRWLMGDAGGKAAFDARLAEIGSVQLAKSISGHRAGEQDDSYEVEYPKLGHFPGHLPNRMSN
jgi:hypothetical protein